MSVSPGLSASFSLLKRELLLLYASLTERLARCPPRSARDGRGGCREVPLSLIQSLSRCLSLAGAPEHRSLPVLQSCAKSLFYLTAL